MSKLAVGLLDAAPGLRILCTSQVPLDVDGEAVFELAPLTLPDAVKLFTDRASAQRLTLSSRVVDDAVLDLCRSLDGLPRAIELAAARTKDVVSRGDHQTPPGRFSVLSDQPAADRNGEGHCDRPSGGAMSCCSPTTSEDCGLSPPSLVVHPFPLWSSSLQRWMFRWRRRWMWLAGSRVVHW